MRGKWYRPFPATEPFAYGTSYFPGVWYGDNATGVVVGGNAVPNTTLVWDSTTWSFVTGATSIPDVVGNALSWHQSAGVVVWYGGRTAAHVTLDDTWTWDGTDWTLLSPATRPPPSANLRMAYDPINDKTVAYGPGTVTFDTWLWDGTTWTQATPAHSPVISPGNGDMCWDSTRGEIVLYFNRPTTGPGGPEMWTWDGTDWTQIFPSTMPATQTNTLGLSLCDEPDLGVVVMSFVDGSGMLEVPVTWHWDGTDWTQALTCEDIVVPFGAYTDWMLNHPMFFDETLRRVLKITSNDNNLNGPIETRTWLYPDRCSRWHPQIYRRR